MVGGGRSGGGGALRSGGSSPADGEDNGGWVGSDGNREGTNEHAVSRA